MRFPWFRATVEGLSMIPVLAPGERVLVRRTRDLGPGNVVVAHDPEGRLVVKRLIRSEITAQGEPGWWLEGDNAAASTDSRTYGAVPTTAMLGRVVHPRRATRPS
ncbi:MAG: nickel-type superoxide dismutase maturation protease [Actinobacteria bacterium]|nr:nickel-type superoxide dismutase maturation protease [Actinomycetota bacterium]